MNLVLDTEEKGFTAWAGLVLGVRSRPAFEPQAVTRAPLCAWPPEPLLGWLPVILPMWLPAGRGRKLQAPSPGQ